MDEEKPVCAGMVQGTAYGRMPERIPVEAGVLPVQDEKI